MSCTLPYPRDNLRYKYFTKESNQHQAKMELRTFLWAVDKYTRIGQTILDPMAGTGTVHIAEMLGRFTTSIEVVPEFQALIEANWQHLLGIEFTKESLQTDFPFLTDEAIAQAFDFSGNMIPKFLKGDSRRLLPVSPLVDAVIFSPPYGNLWAAKSKTSKIEEEKNYRVGYNEHVQNIGNAKNYMSYLVSMKLIYKGCFESLKPGGIIVSVVKDYIQKGDRVLCSRDNLRVMMEVGFLPEDWHYRDASTTNNPFSVGAQEKAY